MKNGWKIFVGALLVVIGVIINLSGALSVVQIAEPWQSILFAILLAITFYGLLSNREYSKDVAVMALILVVIYYFGARLPLTAITSIIPVTILRILSIVCIVIGSVMLALAKTKIKIRKQK